MTACCPAATPCVAPAQRAPAWELDHATIRNVEPMLRAFAYRSVRREDLANDLVQETYLAALQNRDAFEGRSKLRTWLVGILARKIADHFRRTRREVVTDAPPEPEPDPSATRRMADGRLDQRHALELVDRHLGRLPELERLAVLLCDVEQMDRPKAADALGVDRGHLRVLLHRGRHKLRRALDRAGVRPEMA